jgi:MarR family transcriptional regulator, transcriptional regulator for hemolysin
LSIDHELFHKVHQLSRKLTKILNEVLQPYGLYSAQWSVIFVLKQKETLTQKELCDYLSVEAPPMTRTIKRLVEQKYVVQELGDDKRKKYVRLTEKAIANYPEWEQVVLQMHHSLLQSFPETSRKQLSSLLSGWMSKL